MPFSFPPIVLTTTTAGLPEPGAAPGSACIPGGGVRIRAPLDTDGAALWKLARDAPGLDLNSPYSYLILCRHFAETCVVAESGSGIIGFLTGYLPPGREDTVFVWQIAVAPGARRTGLGLTILAALLDRLLPDGVRFLEATVTPTNSASLGLFRSLARNRGVHCIESEFFGGELFPEAGEGASPHQREVLLRLGPFEPKGSGDGHHKPKEAEP